MTVGGIVAMRCVNRQWTVFAQLHRDGSGRPWCAITAQLRSDPWAAGQRCFAAACGGQLQPQAAGVAQRAMTSSALAAAYLAAATSLRTYFIAGDPQDSRRS